ncbi:hypothetical protein ACJX0J_012034, partial [Zea mays]
MGASCLNLFALALIATEWIAFLAIHFFILSLLLLESGLMFSSLVVEKFFAIIILIFDIML